NLDPTVLFAPTEAVEAKTREVLDAAAGLDGHVFNLGHGVMPSTDPDALTRLVEYVHTRTAR
ncbi:uroporphyrinogen decarboxylase family protein, partial [Streptomyces sp. NRRL S-481]